MLLKMVGQGLLAAAIIAALAYGYRTYRESGFDGSFAPVQEVEE